MRRNTSFEKPSVVDGHLYYVRLKTKFGPIYKLGFTSWSSVEDRFAYKKNGDEKLIDKVLMFVYLDGAYHVEQMLHHHFINKRLFGTYSNAPDMPFAGNGQSELYSEDILGLDENFDSHQAESTKFNIRVGIAYRSSLTMDIAILKVKCEDALVIFFSKVGKVFKFLFNPKRYIREYCSRHEITSDKKYFCINEDDYKKMKDLPVDKIINTMPFWADGKYLERQKRRKEMAELINKSRAF